MRHGVAADAAADHIDLAANGGERNLVARRAAAAFSWSRRPPAKARQGTCGQQRAEKGNRDQDNELRALTSSPAESERLPPSDPALQLAQNEMRNHRHPRLAVVEARDRGKILAAVGLENIARSRPRSPPASPGNRRKIPASPPQGSSRRAAPAPRRSCRCRAAAIRRCRSATGTSASACCRRAACAAAAAAPSPRNESDRDRRPRRRISGCRGTRPGSVRA